MIPVSDAWKEIHERALLPEGHIEIKCELSDDSVLTFTKNDILSFKHENYGDILSGELPKNGIEFSLNNVDGRWNPNNPTGLEQYLFERQKITLRYGFDIGGSVEWIDAGVFYLTEWDAPPNGIEARFKAEDIFAILNNSPFKGELTGDLETLLISALTSDDLPEDFEYSIDSEALKVNEAGTWWWGSITSDRRYSRAEIVQLCANASALTMYQDRNGVLHVEKFNKNHSGFLIPKSLSYSHPEIVLSKSLRRVVVAKDVDDYILEVGDSGEEQSVINPFISDYYTGAAAVAELIALVLKSRKKVTGEFRGDPRLELFDVVTVESKYGSLFPVAVTSLKTSFNGSFRTEYEGRVLPVEQIVLGAFVLGENKLGDAV